MKQQVEGAQGSAPQELYKKTESGFEATGVWYCGKCRIVHREKLFAEQCCATKYCDCGKPLPNYYTRCFECQRIKATERTQAQIEAAEKLTDWDGWVCDPNGRGDQDGYFESLDAMIEWYGDAEDDEGEMKLPEFVFTTTPIHFQVDLDSAIESALEDHHEDAAESLDGREEIEKLVREWAARQSLVSYQIDYKRVIPTTAKPPEAL